jgi:ATP-dependent protease ClpP protease subunit
MLRTDSLRLAITCHEGRSSVFERIVASLEQLRRLEEQHLLDVLAQHTGRTKEAWADVFHAGRFILPRQALELGALDEIQGTGQQLAPKPST